MMFYTDEKIVILTSNIFYYTNKLLEVQHSNFHSCKYVFVKLKIIPVTENLYKKLRRNRLMVTPFYFCCLELLGFSLSLNINCRKRQYCKCSVNNQVFEIACLYRASAVI